MTTGQVPKKSGYSDVDQRRARRVSVVQHGFFALTILTFASGFAARAFAAEEPSAFSTGDRHVTGWQLAQDVVVPPVKRQRPADGTPIAPEHKSEPAPTPPPPDYQLPSQSEGGVLGAIQDWLARANREYQGIVVRELSSPPPGSPSGAPGSAEDAIAKKLEEQQQEDARAAAAQAAADARAAEAKRLADDRRRAEETKRLADEASRKADEILKDVPPPSAQTLEVQRREAQKVADENRRQEELRQAEVQRRADAERKRLAAAEAARAEAARADAARIEAATQAESARVAAARADATRQETESRRAEDAKSQMHRRRTIVLTTEPIERPSDRGTMNRPELASDQVRNDDRYASYRLMIVARPHVGTAVKRWVRRVDAQPHRCRAAGHRAAVPGRYTVKRGDSLWRISKRHYRKGKLYKRIYAANRKSIREPDLIYPCQRLFVPRKRR